MNEEPAAPAPGESKAPATPSRAAREVLDAEGPTRWPIHQRLIGAALRAAFATAGALPLAAYVLVKDYRRWAWEWLWGVLAGGLCALVVFACERRGSVWWKAALRLGAAGACAAVVAPLTVVWLYNLGNPAGAYLMFTDLLRRGGGIALLLAAITTSIALPLLGVWVYVRNRTASLLPQVGAGLLTVAVPTITLLADRPSRNLGWAFFFLASGVLVPLGTWFADRLAGRWDPDAPPPVGGDLRLVWAVSGVVAWSALSLPFGGVLHRSSRPYRTSPAYSQGAALRALRSVTTAQLLFQAGDKNADGAPDFAGSMTELGREGLIEEGLGGGVSPGYVFRLIRGSEAPEATWAAAADPIDPRLRRHFVTNHEGVVYTSSAPIPLDPKTCELPQGLDPAY